MENYTIYGPWPETSDQDVLTAESLSVPVHELLGEFSNAKSRKLTLHTSRQNSPQGSSD
jgi:hypothetical protein